jgi:drug/metabolite transporter (DMT)-like permease
MAWGGVSRIRADLMLLACAAVWGFAFLFQKRAMEHIGPMLFVAVRSVLAMAVLVPLAWREWRAVPRGKDQRRLLKMSLWAGLMFFGGAWFQQVGIITATVTNSGFLTSLYVVLTPFVAWAVHQRTPTRWVWLAVALSAVGTWLLGGGALSGFSQGDVLVAISAVFWAVYVVVVGLGSSEAMPSTFTAIQFLVVAILGGTGVVVSEEVDLHALWRAAPDLAFVGLLSSALMFTLFSAAMQFTQPTETAVIVSLEAVFAALAAWLFLNERLPTLGWFGAVLLITATIVVHLPITPTNVSTETDDVKKAV